MPKLKSKPLRKPAKDTIPELVNETEAARLTGYTVEGLRSRRYAGLQPPWYKIGHFVRYAPTGLQAWIAGSRQTVA
jgi:hypothetical protein